MDIRKELEIAEATEVAHYTWESVTALDGPIAFAKGWLSLGQEQLRYLGKYNFGDEAAAASLDADVQRLREIIAQREQTAQELVEAAAAEATNNA